MLKGQKPNLVSENEYHNKEERVKVINSHLTALLEYFIHWPLGCAR